MSRSAPDPAPGETPAPAAPAAATYLYCLVRDEDRPSLDGAPAGLPAAGPPRLLDGRDGLWMVACDAPLPDYGEASIEAGLDDLAWVSDRAVAHERIVEHLLAPLLAGEAPRRALVPLKLFTLFADDARALAWLDAERERLAGLCERLAGRVELGARVRFDVERARREAEAADAAPATGTDFLRAKRRRRDALQDAAPRAAEAAAGAFAELAEAAEDARRREVPEGATAVLLDAAFLVPASRVADFEAVVERAAARLAETTCELTLTGPWPPYHFVGEAR